MGTQNQNTTNKGTLQHVLKGARVLLGIIGVLSLIVTIVSLTGYMTDLLIFLNIRVEFGPNQEFLTTLTAALLTVISLFFAFSPAIDRFFNVMERKEIKLSKDEEKSGVSLEFIFFISIAIVLTIIAILLGIGELVVEAELPLLGRFTELS